MAGGFPFSSVPWHTTNAAKFVGNVGLGPLAKSATPNCSLKCNCEAGFDAFTDRSKATDSRYWESDDSSGVEVRRCFDPSFSSVAGYQLAGDLSKCSNNSATATTLGSVFNSSHSTGPNCIRCEEQRPALDAKISASSRQNPSILAVHSLHDGRTCPKYGSESKTSNPTQKVSLEFKPDSIDNVYYPTMLSKSSGDLDFGFLRGAKSREPEVEIYGKDRATFPKSINESRLQEGYPSGDVRCDNYNKIQENGKVSKRKAGKMERNEMVADVHSGRNVDEDSRILRVSRLTGGKDRHSKVLTAKGIRDRRVRLSVRTAIQFYDLQDRLGFEQPSKAVDWLIHTARSAIEELPVLDAEMSASAGNLTRLISSNSSHLEHCVASPRHSATTAAAASPFRFGLASLEGEGTSFRNTINEKVIPIVTLRDLDTARSGSSISNGSIKESLEHYTSNSSMSKPSSRVESRLEARERARKKLTSAKISDRSLSAIGQLKPMQPSLSSQLKGVFPYTTVPVASQCIKDYPCGIHTQDLSITESVQPLWDYNMPPYTGNLITAQDFQPLQNMATLGLPSIQNCFRPVSSTADSIRVIGSSSLQSYEMPDSAIPLSDEKQIRHFRSNTE